MFDWERVAEKKMKGHRLKKKRGKNKIKNR